MPLKTLVKVGSITNLSDARYCAGMGVDMLGFRVIEGQENYVSPTLYQEMRGWISGPKIVIELYGITSPEAIEKIIRDYAPDFVELSFAEHQKLGDSVPLPLIVSLTQAQLDLIKTADRRIAYWLTEETPGDISESSAPVLAAVQNITDLQDKLNIAGVKGIALKGSTEIRPGFKNYDDLADVLEMLEC